MERHISCTKIINFEIWPFLSLTYIYKQLHSLSRNTFKYFYHVSSQTKIRKRRLENEDLKTKTRKVCDMVTSGPLARFGPTER